VRRSGPHLGAGDAKRRKMPFRVYASGNEIGCAGREGGNPIRRAADNVVQGECRGRIKGRRLRAWSEVTPIDDHVRAVEENEPFAAEGYADPAGGLALPDLREITIRHGDAAVACIERVVD